MRVWPWVVGGLAAAGVGYGIYRLSQSSSPKPAAGPPPPAPQPITVTELDTGRLVTIAAGQPLLVSLKVQPSQGGDWQMTGFTGPLNVIDNGIQTDPSSMQVGGFARHVFTVGAAGVGSGAITFQLIAPDSSVWSSVSFMVVVAPTQGNFAGVSGAPITDELNAIPNGDPRRMQRARFNQNTTPMIDLPPSRVNQGIRDCPPCRQALQGGQSLPTGLLGVGQTMTERRRVAMGSPGMHPVFRALGF